MKNTCKILALVLVLMMMFAMTSMFTASAESAGETWSVVGPLTGGWDAGAAPEMTYDEATGAYVLVLYNVQAGTYEYKVIKDKKWGVKEYPSNGNYSVVIKENGSTVTVKLLNNTVTVEQEVPAPCEHDFSAGNICLESVKCSKCDVHSGIPKAHIYGTDTVCDNCGFDHTQTHKVYFKNTPNWDKVTVHNWSDAGGGTTWPGSLATKEGDFYVFEIPAGRDMCIFNNNGQGSQTANLLVPAEPMVYNFETQKWEELPHTHEFVEGKCECGEEDPNYVPPHVNTLVVGDTNKIVVTGDTLNDWNLPIEWVAFVADESAFYTFAGDNGALAYIFTADGALVSATGAANLDAGTYLICLGNGLVGEFNVAVTKSAWVNALVEGANKIYVDGSLVNAFGLPITWVTFTVTEKAHYKFTCAEEGALAFIFADDYTTSLDGYSGEADLEPGTYAICVGGGVTGMFNVTVEKTAIVPEYNWWVSDGSLYTVEGDTIKYNGAGNTYACAGCDVTALAAGKNTFTITITNNGAAAARVRVDLQATVQVGNHKVVNTEAVGGDVWTDAEWGGSIVTVPAGESVTLVITYDETTERGAVKDLIIFADSARGDAETYAADITVSGMEFSKVSNLTHDGEQEFVLGENKVIIDGCTLNGAGTAVEMVKFVVTEKGVYKFTSDALKAFISTSTDPSDVKSYVCGFTGIAELEPGTYYICVGNNDVRGEFTVTAIKEEGDVELPVKNEIVVGDNHYVISDALMGVGFEFIEFTVAEPGTYVVTGGAPMKVYVFTLPNVDLATAGAGAFGWNVDAMEESGFASSFEVVLPEAGTYWFGVNYEYVTDEREFDINISLKEVEEPKPEDPKPEDPKPEDPKDEAPEMNFFQKIIAWFMDLIQKLLAMFKK